MTAISRLLSATGVAALLAASQAHAAEGTGPYVGLNLGQDTVTITGVEGSSAAGLVIGFRIAEIVGVELIANSAEYDIPLGGPGCSMDSSTIGVFGALRSPGKAYVKGRVGILNEELSSPGGCPGGALTVEDTGLSYGIGGGVRLGNAAIELEYTLIEQDVYRIAGTLLINF